MGSAVLFIVYNRPAPTSQVFEAIRQAKPPRMYIAADGPKADRASDFDRCAEVRRIATAVDWPCEVKMLFSEKNQGCRVAVRNAINWFFESEEEGIILEDDTLPHPDFFRFCSVLLERYRNDEKVMAICGGSYFGNTNYENQTYTVSQVFDPWGWATWAKTWQHYIDSMDELEMSFSQGFLKNIGPQNFYSVDYWMKCFRSTRDGIVDSWAYRWTYSIFKRNGLVIYPMRNLVANIGFGPDATHTKDRPGKPLSAIANLPVYDLPAEIKGPKSLSVDFGSERHFYRMRLGLIDVEKMLDHKNRLIRFIWRLFPLSLKKAAIYARRNILKP